MRSKSPFLQIAQYVLIALFGQLNMPTEYVYAESALTTSTPIMNNPDQFAWRLFAEVNKEVPNDPDGRVDWETWALARFVFADPNQPPDWNAASKSIRTLESLDAKPLQLLAREVGRENFRRLGVEGLRPLIDPAAGERNETRMNKATFDFIVKHDLYHLDGQEAFFGDPELTTTGNKDKQIDFPFESREIKAQWRRIDPSRKHLYHTAEITVQSTMEKQLWGLTSLHITTKDIPNWFWATWEHKDNPDRESVIPSRDRAGLPEELRGTKWENYVLRGTQVDFTTSIGVPTILASSQIERGFQETSSCITCHARASIGPKPDEGGDNRLDIFQPSGDGYVGTPDPQWFQTVTEPPTRRYIQTDFVWSLFRAKRKAPQVTPTPTERRNTSASSRRSSSSGPEAFANRPTPLANRSAEAALSKKASAGLQQLARRDRFKLAFVPGTNSFFEGFDPPSTQSVFVDLKLEKGLAKDEVAQRLKHFNVQVVLDQKDSSKLTVLAPADALADLAADPGVAYMTERMERKRGETQPKNLDARNTHQVDQLVAIANTAFGVPLMGQSVHVGIWDGGPVMTKHPEFAIAETNPQEFRAIQLDGSTGDPDEHATHVAGTIGASGKNPSARGMAPEVHLLCHDWDQDTVELGTAANRPDGPISCSNHSYGFGRGWDRDPVYINGQFHHYNYSWWGNPNVSPMEDYLFGKYVPVSREFDEVVDGHNNLSIFVAAGNDREDEPPPLGASHRVEVTGIMSNAVRNADGFDQGGFDTVEGIGVAKNVITIGAVFDILNEPPAPGDIVTTTFSNWGPADDGRIKPDLVANGWQLESTSADPLDPYDVMSGTSMATPAASGISALLCECFKLQRKKDGLDERLPASDELKAILIHTAMADSELPAPNYRIGWGLIRADWAGEFVTGIASTLNEVSNTYKPFHGKGLIRQELFPGSTLSWTGTAKAGDPIRITIVWIDPPAEPNQEGLDDRTPALVNNLDLELTDPNGKVYYPWTLDWNLPQTIAVRTQKNVVDNVERIDVFPSETAAGMWTLRVQGPPITQRFALAVSGLQSISP